LTRIAQNAEGKFTRPREVLRDVPRPLESICIKAMAVRAVNRDQTVRELADDLKRWLADQPVSAYREPLSARLGRWSRRN
jgi:eukaryotic-like serine/threonine-protein kinase